MIPLWVLSFSKCSVGSGLQFNYGPVTTLVKVSPVLRPTLASPDRYGGARAIGLYQHVNLVALRYSHNWSAALYCHGASVAREDVCSNQSNTLKFTSK